jgi:hypothetical protein
MSALQRQKPKVPLCSEGGLNILIGPCHAPRAKKGARHGRVLGSPLIHVCIHSYDEPRVFHATPHSAISHLWLCAHHRGMS